MTDSFCRIAPSPVLLANHFFSVAFYSIWVMFTHPRPIIPSDPSDPHKIQYVTARIDEYPALVLKSFRVVSRHFSGISPLLTSK